LMNQDWSLGMFFDFSVSTGVVWMSVSINDIEDGDFFFFNKSD